MWLLSLVNLSRVHLINRPAGRTEKSRGKVLPTPLPSPYSHIGRFVCADGSTSIVHPVTDYPSHLLPLDVGIMFIELADLVHICVPSFDPKMNFRIFFLF